MTVGQFAETIMMSLPYVPTDQQVQAMGALARFCRTAAPSDSLFMLCGYAGTGKTSLVSALVKSLHSAGVGSVLLAPTGRAAKVFASYSGFPAYTIHRKIYRPPGQGKPFSAVMENQHSHTIFIVDEASMLSTHTGSDGVRFGSGSLLEDLVQYVRSGRNCRLVLVGDNAQLPPVGADFSPALDAVEMSQFGDVVYGSMDEVVRQEQDSGILFNATLVRCMLENGIYEIPKFDMDYKDVEAVSGTELLEALQDCYDRYGRDDTIVITRSNKRANRYNEGIRRINLMAEEELESGDKSVRRAYEESATHRQFPTSRSCPLRQCLPTEAA